MLSSSSPSLLLSALSPLSAGNEAVPAGAETAPGFAELLNGLAGLAVEPASGGKAGSKALAEATAAGEAIATEGEPRTKGKTNPDVAAALPATADAASESGKILPDALPETAEVDDGANTGSEAEPAAAQAKALTASAAPAPAPAPAPDPALPSLPAKSALAAPAQTGPGERTAPRAAASFSRRPAAGAPPAVAHRARPAPARPTTPEGQANEPKPAAAVAITVGAPTQRLASQASGPAAATEQAVPVRPKPARAADLLRVEAPLAPTAPAAPTVTSLAPAEPIASGNVAPPSMPTAMPSPTDIDAALDHLMAAREALMPAEAALAIDHSEFGEVSIRFEQSTDGRLSAELTAADPELKRAVTAAVAADRGAATSSDGDSGRNGQPGNPRSSAGGDPAQGERGQSSAHRDLPSQRASRGSAARQAADDQRPGVFA